MARRPRRRYASRLTSGTGFRNRSRLFRPTAKTLAFTGEYDGNTGRLHRPHRGRRSQARHLSSRRRPRGRAGRRRQAHSVPLQPHQPLALHADSSASPPRAVCPRSCRSPWPAWARTRPTASAWSMPRSTAGSSPPGFTNYVAWKRYRGGSASYLWLVNFPTSLRPKIPRTDSNDIYPMWIGDKIYFLSDRNGPMTLFRYDPQSRKVEEADKKHRQGHCMSASAGPGGIVYEQFGQIHIFDTATGKEHPVRSRSTPISPRCARASRTCRANCATPPSPHRRSRRLRSARRNPHRPRRQGRDPQPHQHARRDGAHPAWSPDGKSVAYFSDEIRRVRAAHQAAERRRRDEEDRAAGQVARSTSTRRWSPDQQVHRLHRQHDQPVDGGDRLRQNHQGGYRLPLRRWTAASAGPAIRSGSRSNASCPTACAPSRCTRGYGEEHADHRRHERCPPSRLRSRRTVSLLHGQHQLRAHLERPGYDQRRARGHQQRVPGGAAQQHSLAAGSGER